MDPQLKLLASLQLGAVTAKVVQDGQGRKCLSVPLGGTDVLFTVTQILLIREILDRGLAIMTKCIVEEADDHPTP